MPDTLITIGFSHYCEKARWALEWAGIPFDERPHCPLFHYWEARQAGRSKTVPILVTREGPLTESTDIVRYANAHIVDGAERLYPEDPDERAAVDEWMGWLDEEVGPDTRRVVYFHMEDRSRRKDLTAMVTHNVPAFERVMFPWAVGVGLRYIRRYLNITEQTVAESKDKARLAFDRLEERLDLGDFLVGDAFTAADLTFAALMAPTVIPPEYGWPLPPLEALPPAMMPWVEECRGRPGGQWVLEIYRQLRRSRSQPPRG